MTKEDKKLYYPSTSTDSSKWVYQNKLGIHNNVLLMRDTYYHSSKVAIYLKRYPFQIYILSINALYLIHKLMFKKFFTWAGKVRSTSLHKKKYDGSINAIDYFAQPYQFPQCVYNINFQIENIRNMSKPTKDQYARLLDTVTEYHPFYDGNGRAIKLFIQLLAMNNHQYLEYVYDSSKMTKALHDSNIPVIKSLLILKSIKSL